MFFQVLLLILPNKYIVIPDLLENGFLPEGIYETTFEEINKRFGFSNRRNRLLTGMKELIDICKQLGCDVFYLDGSFVSKKVIPSDYDACWDTTSIHRESVLKAASESILVALEEEYGGEIYYAQTKSFRNASITILEYFQLCKENPTIKKGILKINL
ncbi:hypothetical protein EZS27_016196 [termite gut metagenome]|uniref:Uncharacterized protein n=1 Tax=termite gut metagenome TaxID=433724 RepID=A0A5J4RNI3_9ZZZZ